LHLLKHSGLELPVYAEDEVAWTSDEIKLAAQSGESHFIRRAALRYDDYDRDDDNLKSVLHLADFVLANICEVLVVNKVEHEWGISKVSHTNPTWRRLLYGSDHELLPKNYGLVARVSTILNATTPNFEQREPLNKAITRNYLNIKKNPAGVYACDLGGHQFVVDPAKLENDRETAFSNLVLVDVEPRMLEVDSTESIPDYLYP
jgi:hypothetical protein